jgi:acetylornithine deacetylase/succinyl-diaminopimelate desuccinylase-like protein
VNPAHLLTAISTQWDAEIVPQLTEYIRIPAKSPHFDPWLGSAIDEASSLFYDKSAAAMGEGGTIPFMAMLGKHFPDAQFLITGVLGPHANAHGPNEFLHVPYAKKLTACVAFVLAAHARKEVHA